MLKWKCALELDSQRNIIGGSTENLNTAIGRGADLRIEATFRHNEHIDTSSDNNELIREISEFRVTYLLENRWTAGFMTLRQPAELPSGFGKRPSLSLFMYNQNGQQAIARPFLDGQKVTGQKGPSAPLGYPDMPKYHQQDSWDFGTNAPSQNFIYDFGCYKYWVNDEWKEVLSHDQSGKVISGSLENLVSAFENGAEIKVGIKGICSDLTKSNGPCIEHEVFVQVGFLYYYTETKLLLGETHPVVRVAPEIPLWYRSSNWDYGWLLPRTDGFVAMLICDPYTLQFRRMEGHFPIRWFVR